MAKTWYSRLKELREEKGLTQGQLAEQSGLTQGFISLLERGERKFTQESLDSILLVLKASYHHIFVDKTKEELKLELGILEARIKIMEKKWNGTERRGVAPSPPSQEPDVA